MTKTKDNLIKQEEKENLIPKEYIIIGSDNFWYGSGFFTIKEALDEIKLIKKNPSGYGNPENNSTQTELPETFYIYSARLVKEI
jgi:hypothetical protein